jgi:hypothetical protein
VTFRLGKGKSLNFFYSVGKCGALISGLHVNTVTVPYIHYTYKPGTHTYIGGSFFLGGGGRGKGDGGSHHT